MSLLDLATKTEKELSKMSKSAIIAEITKHNWMVKSKIDEVKNLEEKVIKANEELALVKVLLSGYLGDELQKNEYNGEIELQKVSATELVGRTLSKAARY